MYTLYTLYIHLSIFNLSGERFCNNKPLMRRHSFMLIVDINYDITTNMARKKKARKKFPTTEYKVEIAFSPEDDSFVARIPELPGCVTHGDSQQEALKMAYEAIEVYLESLIDAGKEVPTPMARKKFSGNIPLRIDPVLHRDIALKADGENLSVNKYIEKLLKAV